MITNKRYNLDITTKSLSVLKNVNSYIDGNIFHLHTHILYDLRTMILKENAVYLEIGTCSGSSFCLMLNHPKKTHVIGIDDAKSAPGGEITIRNNISKANLYRRENNFIVGNSQDNKVENTIRELTNGVDIFFIDGDHSFEGTINDFIKYKDLILPGGYVVFDDYHDYKWSPQVKHAVDYIVEKNICDGFEVLGYLENTTGLGNKYKPFSNEFILKKI
jgi:cephalosporin hydroxylase